MCINRYIYTAIYKQSHLHCSSHIGQHDGKAFEDKAGTTTSSTADDILDFSERNPFGEVDDY